MKLPIYLDYSATTPVDPRVAQKMCDCLTPDGIFGNPASRSHPFGWKAEEAVEEARSHVAALVNCDPKEIVWTSGATESNNLALIGYARRNKRSGGHVVITEVEHISVLNIGKFLEQEGFKVTRVPPDQYGRINPDKLRARITDDTILVSLSWASNEIGTVQPIAEIGRLCQLHGIRLLVDASQTAGKVQMRAASSQSGWICTTAAAFWQIQPTPMQPAITASRTRE